MGKRYEIMAEALWHFQETDDVSDVEKMEKLHMLWLESSTRQRAIIDMVFIELCGYSFETIIEECRKEGDLLQKYI